MPKYIYICMYVCTYTSEICGVCVCVCEHGRNSRCVHAASFSIAETRASSSGVLWMSERSACRTGDRPSGDCVKASSKVGEVGSPRVAPCGAGWRLRYADTNSSRRLIAEKQDAILLCTGCEDFPSRAGRSCQDARDLFLSKETKQKKNGTKPTQCMGGA